jgi:hypothetical protein
MRSTCPPARIFSGHRTFKNAFHWTLSRKKPPTDLKSAAFPFSLETCPLAAPTAMALPALAPRSKKPRGRPPRRHLNA